MTDELADAIAAADAPQPLVITVRVNAPRPLCPFTGGPHLYDEHAFEKAIGQEFDGPAGRSKIIAATVVDDGKAADVTLELYTDASALAEIIRAGSSFEAGTPVHGATPPTELTPPGHMRDCCDTYGLDPHAIDCENWMPGRVR